MASPSRPRWDDADRAYRVNSYRSRPFRLLDIFPGIQVLEHRAGVAQLGKLHFIDDAGDLRGEQRVDLIMTGGERFVRDRLELLAIAGAERLEPAGDLG